MFLKNIFRTFYDKSFYIESEGDSFWKRYGALYFFHFLLALFMIFGVVSFYNSNKIEVTKFASNIGDKLPTLYPEDLEMTIKNGELSINQEEPYVLGNEVLALFGEDETNASGAALVTISTKASIDDFDSYKSAVLLTQKGALIKQSEMGEIRFYPYTQFIPANGKDEAIVFNYKEYMKGVKEFAPLTNKIPEIFLYGSVVFATIGLLLVPVFSVSGWLFALLFWSVLGYFVAILIKRKHSYGYIYKLGMYFAIPLSLLQNIHMISGYLKLNGSPDFGGYTWLVYLLLLALFVPVAKQEVLPGNTLLDPPASVTNK